jgi:amino acid adenylation domain-containing protein
VERPLERIGVLAERSVPAYVGALASLLAGAAFVPLNPRFPVARIRAVLELADLDALILDGTATSQVLPALIDSPACPSVVLAAEADPQHLPPRSVCVRSADLDRTPPLAALPQVGPDDDAYLMFTSGSTGAPKGVPITHSNITSFLASAQSRYGIDPDDRLTQTFDPTFDLYLFDLFMAWSHGASLRVLDPLEAVAPAPALAAHRVTVWFSVPSAGSLIRRRGSLLPDSLPGLRLSLFCGEALPGGLARAWQEAAPRSVLENLYGPTELTVACTAYRWDPEESPQRCVNGVVPIGRAFDGLTALVVDGALRPVSPGHSGELCVAGPQQFEGYWRAPEADAGRFFEAEDGAGVARRFYRTGDRVRELPEGDLAYIGRLDQQVKVLGHRVELGDVEAALRAQEGVWEAVVMLAPPGDLKVADALEAFVTGQGVDGRRLRGRLRERIPAHMVPRSVTVVESMPLNANGKVDRRALSQLHDASAATPVGA